MEWQTLINNLERPRHIEEEGDHGAEVSCSDFLKCCRILLGSPCQHFIQALFSSGEQINGAANLAVPPRQSHNKNAIVFKMLRSSQKDEPSSCALGKIYVHRYSVPTDKEAFITHC